MDFESLLPIAIGVIYLINRVLKERKKQKQKRSESPAGRQQTSQPTPQRGGAPKKKPFTFDDILKEFEKNLAGEEEFEQEKPLPVEEIRYNKPQPVSVKQEKKPNIYETFEGASYETPDVLAEDRSENEAFSRNENYKIMEEEEENEFIKLLREPDGPKKAIVLSEILNRKHF